MTSDQNVAFMRLARRAESVEPSKLVATFVDAGPLFNLLSSTDHQIVYGRRGTGKTHALLYLGEQARQKSDIPLYVDMRTIGSTGGLYSDPSISTAERGTRLLLDTLEAIHEKLVDEVLEASEGGSDFGEAMNALDRLAEEIVHVEVAGEVEQAERHAMEDRRSSGGSAAIGVSRSGPTISIGTQDATERGERTEIERVQRGEVRHTVRVGAVTRFLAQFVEAMRGRRLWILLDEWSVVPLELQPLLADMTRRCFLPIRGVTVKIGAIEYRSFFMAVPETGGYTGIEIGADMSADVDLDDFMVFGNDAEKAKEFFKLLVHKHLSSYFASEEKPELIPPSANRLLQQAFTQENAFAEFVRSAEGVPRDALNVLSLAAQLADDRQISMNDVRGGARRWYIRDKETAVSANARGKALLDWVTDEVIGNRRARAFLLEQGHRNHPLIGGLYDSRVLHVIKKGVAARDLPGRRFDVYALDYGCYVELIATARAPEGLFEAAAGEAANDEYVDVPADDYRSIRRAILDLEDFEKAVPIDG
jgi:hypothetical protein